MTEEYSHHTLYRESHLSFSLLKEILSENDETLELKDDKILLSGIPLRDNYDKMLLVYSDSSKKLRRKNKKKYDYFNAFKNQEHNEYIIHFLTLADNNIDCIEIEEMNDKFSVKFKNIDNKVLKERVSECNINDKNKIIMDMLLKYYNII
ncbi:hypothetical protein INTERNEXUS_191 [Bacillus phage vB_BspM_Internexus]|nr:hypothetical protein INTERNEXUS_191 [Bacillus phage vB_BspM_Internexus]